MDKDQTVEVIDLLEDIIGELSGSYVTGTGKDGIPKRLYQVIDYFNGKSTDTKERIFTTKELKAIDDNKRAKAVVMKAYNVYNQRIEAGKNLQSRIYGCYSQKIPINGDVERANFEIASFERINSLNQEHFDHMSEQNCISCDEYMKIIESHINSLESVYLKELEDKITEFSQVHNSETVIFFHDACPGTTCITYSANAVFDFMLTAIMNTIISSITFFIFLILFSSYVLSLLFFIFTFIFTYLSLMVHIYSSRFHLNAVHFVQTLLIL